MLEALETYHDLFQDCHNSAQLIDRLWTTVRRKGIEDFNYGMVLLGPDGGAGECIKFRSWPSPWDDFYLEQSYHKHDDLVDYCREHTDPVFWDAPQLIAKNTAIQNKISNEAQEFGIHGGRAYPLAKTAGTLIGLFNIVQRSPFDSQFKSWEGRDQELHSLINFAHLKMVDLQMPEDRSVVEELSELEKVSLYNLIRQRDLSESGLVGLSSARRKLAAFSNHEAIFKALNMGMINP